MAGRPRGFDRDAALAVATELFWRRGFTDTSVATLTAAMGVTPPSLYAAFGDKQSLFEEASAEYFRRTCEAVDEAAELPTVREALGRMLDDTARAHTDTATPPGCLMLTEPRLASQREILRIRLRDRLDRGVHAGELATTTHTDHLASFLLAVMRGMSGCARDGGTTEDLLAIADAAMTVLQTPPTE
ncbi:TetR/AcrR family transcriptional regulator [Rhodococcus sp. ARC_M12]|uniref:TetR/AcrR family transcriptional regulator n=1 Tax=unclassified Rhodococcus (in: high G+C Gram-positive bacteria) TaxID=192944 RepID=UPI001FB27B0D|nr:MULTISPECIES: TetR/AcrR family transcriptional regulator [unclassified Rhodococcus (in: high G+C Gram-positive bacteria)]MCJ0893116.1 TetR/AcrR family transcriptional regulator [Rhodococcus sp. ARC_M5]MCJ0977325.1 TetR/AcrR family transcriptional regulator [Rhodococcus sp. ARC_M12]